MRALLYLFLCAWLSVAGAAPEPLPPQQAFRLSARVLDAQTLEIRFAIEKGYYLYRDKFRFVAQPAGTLGPPQEMPPGVAHRDDYFGEQVVYRDALALLLPLRGQAGQPFRLTVTHQGCADIGICYPPTTEPVDLKLEPGSSFPPETAWQKLLGGVIRPGQSGRAESAPAVSPATVAATESSAAPALQPQEDASHVAGLLRDGNLALVIASFFGFGVLLAFTPCVLPMVPILSGLIVGHGHHISRGRALFLSSAYVLGMAFTYALAGIAAGLSGTLLATWLQNVWVLGAIGVLFLLLALAMFDVYTLQLPARWQHRLTHSANRHAGSPGGLAVTGALSALIVGPCVAAPLAGALLYIAQTGDAMLGGVALFAMALGMGLPLILVGVAARHWLPKAGAWMEGVKRFFGMLLLATALWLVGPLLPPIVPMLGWAVLLVTGGVLLRALDPLPEGAHGALRLFKALGVLALLAGAAIFIGALAGSRNPLQPLAGLRGVVAAQAAQPVRFERVRSLVELDARLAAADRPVMLDFYADWCVSCKEMEHYTFTDPAVAAELARFTLLQADVTANSPEDRALLARFGLFGPPGILFFQPGGEELRALRVIGYVPAERFKPVLAQARGGG